MDWVYDLTISLAYLRPLFIASAGFLISWTTIFINFYYPSIFSFISSTLDISMKFICFYFIADSDVSLLNNSFFYLCWNPITNRDYAFYNYKLPSSAFCYLPISISLKSLFDLFLFDVFEMFFHYYLFIFSFSNIYFFIIG